MKFYFSLVCLVLMTANIVLAQTVSEKKQQLYQAQLKDEQLQEIAKKESNDIEELKACLISLQKRGLHLFEKEDMDSLEEVIAEISVNKRLLKEKEKLWLLSYKNTGDLRADCAFWNHSSLSIKDLLSYYGSDDCLFLIPQELNNQYLSLSSKNPWLKASWDEMLQAILESNGFGLRQVSSFIKEVYQIKEARFVEGIVDTPAHLELFGDFQRVCFVLSKQSLHYQDIKGLLSQFFKENDYEIAIIKDGALLFANTLQIKEFLKILSFLEGSFPDTGFNIFPIRGMLPSQIKEILKNLKPHQIVSENSLIAFDEKKLLFASGSKEFLVEVENLINSIYEACGKEQSKKVFTHYCRFADPQKLGEVLGKVHGLLKDNSQIKDMNVNDSSLPSKEGKELAVSPMPVSFQEKTIDKKKFLDSQVVVDSTTGMLIMVVEEELLGEVQKLVRRLDVPKKMVRIDVLLVEKRMSGQQRLGLNLLNVGSKSEEKHETGGAWQVIPTSQSTSSGATSLGGKGILKFCLSRASTSDGWPGYDLAYSFLISQEDMQINANPSIVAMNQTPASIDLVDEISVSTGVEEIPTINNGVVLKNSFVRSQYGIHIEFTPLIHDVEEAVEGSSQFITLKTQLIFDTQRSSRDNRPDVFRRQIQNEVRVANGETIILGGLRQKDSQNDKEIVPFMGEIPGIGKLFSSSGVSDFSTEMFIFITPKIVEDPQKEMHEWKQSQLMLRPGDDLQLLDYLLKAQETKKKHLFYSSLKALLGP
jgi:general secretion pathway protein D